MYTAVVVPPARKRSLELQNYAAHEWNANASFLEKEFVNRSQKDAAKGVGVQYRPAQKGWAFRWARSVPQHK